MSIVTDIKGNNYPSENLIVFNMPQGLAIENPTKKPLTIAYIDNTSYKEFLLETPRDFLGKMAGMAVVPPSMRERFLVSIVHNRYSPAELLHKLKGDVRSEGRDSYFSLENLDKIDDLKLADYVLKRAASSQTFAAILTEGLPQAFTQAAMPQPTLSVPSWRKRTPGVNAAQFIRDNYGKYTPSGWHHNGISRPELKSNLGLYNAYAAWISDHPEDTLTFAEGKSRGRPRSADPVRTVERSRERARDGAARRKEQRRSPQDGPA